MQRQRTCWICFAQEGDASDDQQTGANDDRAADDVVADEWVSPCRCRGTTKWTHQKCIQRWIDEKQGGLTTLQVTCPQCKEPYRIGFPRKGFIAETCDMFEKCVAKSCPFVAGGILVGSAYWIGVTYGAITVMQVLGHKEGLSLMERADPLFLLIGLPTIPVMLVLSRFIKWQDIILTLWRNHSHKLFGTESPGGSVNQPALPVGTATSPLPMSTNTANSQNDSDDEHMDAVSVTRLVNGGLILPTMATLFGKVMFQRIDSNIQRSFLGGMVYVILKGILKIYCRQLEYKRRLHRKVLFCETEQEDIQ